MLTVYDGSTASSFYTLSQSVPIMYEMSGWKGGVRKIDLDAFFQLAEDVTPFHTLPDPACHSGFFLVCHEDLHGIPHAHASGRAKNRAPFHLATLALIQPPGVQQGGGRVHQGIARHGRLAKNRAPHLIRRNEPSTGALPSNTILRFEKASYTYHFLQSKDIPYALRGSFIGILGGPFGLVFADRPGHGRRFASQSATELLASIRPRIRHTLSSLNILESRLSLLHDQGSRQFDQVFGQPFALLLGEHGRVVPR